MSELNITIFGIGGGGCNAVKRILDRNEFSNVRFIASNTDKIALDAISDREELQKVYIGQKKTQGMGTGGDANIGEQAAKESADDIRKAVRDTKILFITAGMGGGTGTGASSVVAEIAGEMNILTIGIVTKPFRFEGTKKMTVAENGIEKLSKHVDILIVVPNNRPYSDLGQDVNMYDVFASSDSVLQNSVWAILNAVGNQSIIHTDFADLFSVLKKKGKAHIGIGQASGENRVLEALRKACKDPVRETSIAGAHNVIVHAKADKNVQASKIIDAFTMIPEVVASDANIITGFDFGQETDSVTITVIATDFVGIPVREETITEEKKGNETDKEGFQITDLPPYLQYINNK